MILHTRFSILKKNDLNDGIGSRKKIDTSQFGNEVILIINWLLVASLMNVIYKTMHENIT